MSGPKVIRIVTREEIIEICLNHLARLDAAIASWTRVGERNGTIDAADISAVRSRREVFHALLAKDRFADVQKGIPAEIAFLKTDAQERLAKAASVAAEAAQVARRIANTAATLLKSLAAAQRQVPMALRQRLEKAADGGAGAETAISEAFKLLSVVPSSKGPTERQRELAAHLGAGGKQLTLAEWRAANAAGGDPAIERIEVGIATLRTIADPKAAASFERRLAAIIDEPSAARRALLLDSIGIDLGAATKARRDHEAVAEQLAELQAEITRLDTTQARALAGEIERAMAKEELPAMKELKERAAGYLAAEMKARAITARRMAVLQGLASLGYEVAEGMSTAWVKDGKLVLRKAASPEYGVEVGGGADAERFQVRAVGFGARVTPRDAARDRDMEAIWCNEFERLQAMVGKSGGVVTVDKALAVGESPLKVIDRIAPDDRRIDGIEGKARSTRSRS